MRRQLAALGDRLKNWLSVAGDLIILNLLFILCSIPVITLGAAEAACYTRIFRILLGERASMPIAGFFKDFAAGFKKATLGWLIELACLAILAGDIWFAVGYSEPDNTFFLIFAIVLAAVILFAAAWFYPLVARFENTLRAHIKNSFLMALAHFPKTLLAFLIQAAAIAIPVIFFDAFANLGWFWLLFGASLPLYLTAKLIGGALKCEQAKPEAEEKK